MGHQRNRKRERQSQQRQARPAFTSPWDYADPFDDDRLGLLFEMQHGELRSLVAKTCNSCADFIEDENAGRGECLHPGSGILSPWSDTPACGFHSRRR